MKLIVNLCKTHKKVNEDVKSEEDNKENIKDTQNAEETKDAKEEVAKTDKVQAESDVENTDDNKTDEAVKDGKKITKYTIENVNGILTSLKDSIPGKLVAQTKISKKKLLIVEN